MGEQSYKDIENEYMQENRDKFEEFLKYIYEQSQYHSALEIELCAVYGKTSSQSEAGERFRHNPAFKKMSKKYQDDLDKKDKRISELEEQVKRYFKGQQDNDMEKFKGLHRQIKELKDEVAELKEQLKKAEELNQYTIEEYDNYVAYLEDRLKQAQAGGVVDSGIPTDSDSSEFRKRNKGKVLELSYRALTEVIRLYCMGKPNKEIVKETGASRGQVDRIISGKLYHKASRQKVLRAVNQLLRVNQNKDMIKKLNRLKGMYQVDMDEDLEMV